MTTDCAQKKVWLAQAELALHNLLTGAAEEQVQFGPSKSVTYTRADINQLKAYIADLKNQVAECEGQPQSRRGPIRFAF